MPEQRSGTSERAIQRPAATGSARVYQLKVSLPGSRPPIWRRLEVSGEVTLSRFHAILQIAMGWEDRHLHLFAAGKTVYRLPLPDLGFPCKDERKVALREVLTREKERIRYEYDFRDGWEHIIVLEKILPPGSGSKKPLCLAGKRRCPPERSGGIVNYERLLTALRKRSRPRDAPEHAEIAEWLEAGFDPEAFDLDEVNGRLARLK
jgi:hypothetical protein